ncbi:MAG: hypothetical protein A2Y17_10420 [Clostridiales bacterium GWF2_38_85]|nr:MAG: hypothetical protein A2Y17_10420 [Clostridiales bacterium GWF2_38_85]HBL84848.1 tRNA nucleotidyltransferase [Clostridiales bacterium]
MMLILPDAIQKALNILKNNNFEGYLVGGSVRDYLLEKSPTDFDITTNATPEQMLEVFQAYRVIETGMKHGTLTVIIDHLRLEITTYRIDGEYIKNRKPENVTFTTNLKDDTARRDFTMNSIAYNPVERFVDYFNGTDDIKNRIIRCVGDPEKRFEEDALRILRALRFSSVLGFSIDEQTENAMYNKKELLLNISAERIAAELFKLLCGDYVKDVLLKYIDILGIVIPELLPMKGLLQNNPYHKYDVWTHTVLAVETIVKEPYMKLAALLHDSGKPYTYKEDEKKIGHFKGHVEVSQRIAADIIQRLKLNNITKHKVLTLIKYHDTTINPDRIAIKKWFNKLSPELFADLLEMKRADGAAKGGKLSKRDIMLTEVNQITGQLMAENVCWSLSKLAVTGNDLIETGITEGKKIGDTLDKLLEAVIEEKVENEEAELLKFIGEKIETNNLY